MRGLILGDAGRFAESLTALEPFKALGHMVKMARTLEHLGRLQRKMGDYEGAITNLLACLEITQVTEGMGTGYDRKLNAWLARVYIDAGMWGEAADAAVLALEPIDGALALPLRLESEVRFCFARALLSIDDPQAASAQAQACIKIREQIAGPGDFMRADAQRLLETALRAGW